VTEAKIPMDDPHFDQRVSDAVAAARYEDRARAIVAEGKKLDGFREAAKTLDTVGLDSAAFIEEVVGVASHARPAELLREVGKDVEQAATLANLSQVQRIRELTKIDAGFAKPTPAAAPPKPAPTPTDWRADKDLDDAAWSKKWDAEYTTPRAPRYR
jgi:hypothetical protein